MRQFYTVYLFSLWGQTLKGNTVNVSVLKLCGWELHDFLAQNKERPPSYTLYSYHFLPACCSSCCMWQRSKGPAPFFYRLQQLWKCTFFHPPQPIQEPSSMKRNPRHSSHIQMIPLEPLLCSYIFSDFLRI